MVKGSYINDTALSQGTEFYNHEKADKRVRCLSCRYALLLSCDAKERKKTGLKYKYGGCNYLYVTGWMRGCLPGDEHCIRYEERSF